MGGASDRVINPRNKFWNIFVEFIYDALSHNDQARLTFSKITQLAAMSFYLGR